MWFDPLPGGEHASSLALALIPIYFAYSGWNAVTYVAGRGAPPVAGRLPMSHGDARILRLTARRIWVRFSRAYPWKSFFAAAHAALSG